MSNAQIAAVLDTVLDTWTADRYTADAFARNKSGQPCTPGSPYAVCWCLEGAVYAALWDAPHGLHRVVWCHIFASVDALYPEEGMSHIDINDEHGYTAARAVLVHARARLKTTKKEPYHG